MLGAEMRLNSKPSRVRPRTTRRSNSAPACVAQKYASPGRASSRSSTTPSAKPSHEAPRGVHAEQSVEQTGVAQVDPGRPYLALREVRVPGCDLAYHERLGQDVEVALDRGMRYAEGSGELGAVPRLCMVVRNHRPE